MHSQTAYANPLRKQKPRVLLPCVLRIAVITVTATKDTLQSRCRWWHELNCMELSSQRRVEANAPVARVEIYFYQYHKSTPQFACGKFPIQMFGIQWVFPRWLRYTFLFLGNFYVHTPARIGGELPPHSIHKRKTYRIDFNVIYDSIRSKWVRFVPFQSIRWFYSNKWCNRFSHAANNQINDEREMGQERRRRKKCRKSFAFVKINHLLCRQAAPWPCRMA